MESLFVNNFGKNGNFIVGGPSKLDLLSMVFDDSRFSQFKSVQAKDVDFVVFWVFGFIERHIMAKDTDNFFPLRSHLALVSNLSINGFTQEQGPTNAGVKQELDIHRLLLVLAVADGRSDQPVVTFVVILD